MLGLLALLWALQLPGSQAAITLEQPLAVLGRRGSSAILPCTVHTKVSYIHWYRHQEGRAPERLLVMAMLKSDVRWDSVLKADKVTAMESKDGSSCTLSVLRLEKNDEGRYYCAAWYQHSPAHPTGSDRGLDGDFSPKPTVFLPSIHELNQHKAGTYLCLLEKFFPDVIKVDWKEKNSNKILTSQQGNTVKTGDSYMKFSWLTATEKSGYQEHKCVVRHEFNEGKADQEILFPSIKKVKEYFSNIAHVKRVRGPHTGPEYTTPVVEFEQVEQTEGLQDPMQLQTSTTTAYYTYLLLLLKTSIYFAIGIFCLLRTTAVGGNGKHS